MTDPRPSPEATDTHKHHRGVLSLFDRFRSRPAEAAAQTPDPPTAATGQLVSQARAFQDLGVGDVMKPRADIVAVAKDCTFAELTARFVEAEHSRMPVYKETLDEPVGVVHVKDLFKLMARKARKPKPTDKVLSGRHNLVRQVLYVPASMRASELLGQMRAEHTHMALVIDEFGGTDGLVTLEDLLETLVGEIEDEHDEDDGPLVRKVNSNTYIASGRAEIEEVQALIGADFDPGEHRGEVDTIGGLVFALAGHVPLKGEIVGGIGNFEFEVLQADSHQARRLKIKRLKQRKPAPKGDAKAGADGKTAD
jgi:CBS domain containing-hemolysin-like protein